MSRIARFAVLVAALASLFAVMSSSAGAVTWTNTGTSTVHATGVGGTLHVGVNHLVCTGATANGTTSPSGGTTFDVTGTVTFTPCVLAGQNTFVSCSYTLTALSHTGGVFGGTTAGNADVTCDAKLEASPQPGLCHISGATAGSYVNPAAAGGQGRLTLNTTSTLVVSNFGSTACPLGTGAGTLTEQSLFTTTANTPILNTD
jgi:hypothetical protein